MLDATPGYGHGHGRVGAPTRVNVNGKLVFAVAIVART